ncbi:uncharacterized protein LOC135219076 [Macrobrachium nipponense]|uniref:uncharacterized protein LOC135219076 n=1 Tax=Macrobrachium nipponense TaxID=159736 RepID=UPI0030C87D22
MAACSRPFQVPVFSDASQDPPPPPPPPPPSPPPLPPPPPPPPPPFPPPPPPPPPLHSQFSQISRHISILPSLPRPSSSSSSFSSSSSASSSSTPSSLRSLETLVSFHLILVSEKYSQGSTPNFFRFSNKRVPETPPNFWNVVDFSPSSWKGIREFPPLEPTFNVSKAILRPLN